MITELDGAGAIVVIVGFRNAGDIAACLGALAGTRFASPFAVMICENGGRSAYESLLAALDRPGGPCAGTRKAAVAPGTNFVSASLLALGPNAIPVFVGEAIGNIGYAGGINACLSAAAPLRSWAGAWILNPDTTPEPEALGELVAFAERHGKGMVGSRIIDHEAPDVVRTRGLRWRKMLASTKAVDRGAPLAPAPAAGDVEARMDSPSGASLYVTRACLGRIGLMDESFFLYFEDLEWGLRAKASCGIGYADRSVVPHVGGTTLGSATSRRDRSRLSVYLEARNRLLFVKKRLPLWYPWTIALSALHVVEFLGYGAFGNFVYAARGFVAGIKGETGRPDHVFPYLTGAAAGDKD